MASHPAEHSNRRTSADLAPAERSAGSQRPNLAHDLARRPRSAQPNWQAAPGAVLGEYVLEQQIGSGATGEVWRAHHHVWQDRLVALKIATNADFLASIEQDGLIRSDLSRIKSPHVVQLLGLNVANDPPYLVMEFIDGENLRAVMQRQGRISLDDTLRLLDGALKGLAEAHRLGIVHRDLKPENVLIDREGTARLTDFSVATRLASEDSLRISLGSNPEQARSIAGTLLYMSPEQRHGEAVDQRSDVFSAGVMLFEMLTGELPQPGDRIGDYLGDVPESVEQVFANCYTRPDRRFRDAGAMLALLQDIRRRRHGLPVSRPPRRAPNPGRVQVPAQPMPTNPPPTNGPTPKPVRKAPKPATPAPEVAVAAAVTPAAAPTEPAVLSTRNLPLRATRPDAPIEQGGDSVILSTRDRPLRRRSEAEPPESAMAHRPAAAADLDAMLRELPDDDETPDPRPGRGFGPLPTIRALYQQRQLDRGVTAYAEGDYRRAGDEFKRVLENRPGDMGARRGLAMSLYQQGKSKQALEVYRAMIDAGSGSAEIWNNIGVISREIGRLRDAEKALLRAVELRPRYGAAHANLGAVYRELGKRELARRHSELALEIDPENLAAGYNLIM